MEGRGLWISHVPFHGRRAQIFGNNTFRPYSDYNSAVNFDFIGQSKLWFLTSVYIILWWTDIVHHPDTDLPVCHLIARSCRSAVYRWQSGIVAIALSFQLAGIVFKISHVMLGTGTWYLFQYPLPGYPLHTRVPGYRSITVNISWNREISESFKFGIHASHNLRLL